MEAKSDDAYNTQIQIGQNGLEEKMVVKREPSSDPEEIVEEMTIEYNYHPIKSEDSCLLVVKIEDEIETENGEELTKGNNKERRNGNDVECETFGPSSINQHLMSTSNHNGDEKKRFKCSICKKDFLRNNYLKLHVDAVHRGLKPHKCSICQRAFSDKGRMKNHINAVHNGLKPHKCSICQKSFSDKRDVKKHLDAVHSGLKPHKCSNCQKSFSNNQTLKKHIYAIHSGLNTYKCSTCEKYYSSVAVLSKHMKIHE